VHPLARSEQGCPRVRPRCDCGACWGLEKWRAQRTWAGVVVLCCKWPSASSDGYQRGVVHLHWLRALRRVRSAPLETWSLVF